MDALAESNAFHRATKTAQHIWSKLPDVLQKPKAAIVCGSGLGGLAETIEEEPKVELAYETIPNFPKSTGECDAIAEAVFIRGKIEITETTNIVQGHAGKFVFGLIGPQKTPVALLVGRAQLVAKHHWPWTQGY